ncbi:hypothetical protein NJF44_11800 [Pseudomonas guariconensis]|uniref:hypothetical protein n=2 Tax=Pseudomonas TaxID=286 RepID=UPI00209B6F7D|nr:hypothetical protein [Pseudomonas guariconensis]MCO7605916.1 hypothetical protein [Pseudomonas guariconensis]
MTMTIQWNRIYTDLLRGSRPTLWGNWALNPNIQPGAVGIVDPASGDFRLVCEQLPGAEVSSSQQGRKWQISSSGVQRREVKTSVAGMVYDPATAAQVQPDAAIEWSFDREESIASEFALSGERSLSNLTLLHDSYDWLLDHARRVNMATAAGISEGFGVVTTVVYAQSGVNAGAKKRNARFSLAGSASGLNRLLGEDGISGKGNASFIVTSDSSAIESHTLPARSGEVASEPLPVAYGFASFAGSRVLVPNWIRKMGVLSLVVDSKASAFTTYTTRVTLSYETPNGPVEDTRTIVGGSSASFSDIPLTATRMTLVAEFINLGKNTRQALTWNTPATEWLGGTRVVNLTGTWPGAPQMKEVDA